MLIWTTRIRCNEHELDRSFSVLVFLGDVPKDPSEWDITPSFVGAYDVYIGRSGTKDGESNTVEGFVGLNKAIARLSGLSSLDPEAVVPYLERNLRWRVRKSGVVIDMQSLEVVVLATPISQPPGGGRPVIGEPKIYDDIAQACGNPGVSH